jgi:hypothetical protein
MRIVPFALLLLAAGGALASESIPCLLKPTELAPVLGHTPREGKPERDPLGNPLCIYERDDELGRRFLLLIQGQPWDRKRYDRRLSLARGSGIREAILLTDVGDAGFYVEGAAGALLGTRYVEISGFKAAATKPVSADEAAGLLRLALQRLPK